jgi:hypothetical protein
MKKTEHLGSGIYATAQYFGITLSSEIGDIIHIGPQEMRRLNTFAIRHGLFDQVPHPKDLDPDINP